MLNGNTVSKQENANIKPKCIIIDDEQHCIEVIEILLKKMDASIEIIKTCSNPFDGLAAIESLKPDIVFIDIQMPDLNGLELIKRVNYKDFEVIFTTAYADYAIQAVRLCALDYLLKPIKEHELKDSVTNFLNRKNNNNSVQLEMLLNHINEFNNGKISRVALPVKDGVSFFETDNIIYIEADGSIAKIYMANGEKKYINCGLKSIEDCMTDVRFMRIHKSFLVNLEKVHHFSKKDGGYIEMINGAQLSISRNRKEELMQRLTNVK